jgi:hypothetical protein
MYIDEEQLKVPIGYFIEVPTLDDALVLARMIGERIQLFTRAKFVGQRILIDNDLIIHRASPSGTIKRRASFLCQAEKEPGRFRPHTFEFVLIDPVPEMLGNGGTRINLESPVTIDFIQNVLNNLTDIHGHAFERVSGAWISQF